MATIEEKDLFKRVWETIDYNDGIYAHTHTRSLTLTLSLTHTHSLYRSDLSLETITSLSKLLSRNNLSLSTFAYSLSRNSSSGNTLSFSLSNFSSLIQGTESHTISSDDEYGDIEFLALEQLGHQGAEEGN